MSYSRNRFAAELDGFLHEPSEVIDHKKIADWAYKARVDNLDDIDPEVDKWLLQLGAMSMGSEFELSCLELRDLVSRAKCCPVHGVHKPFLP